MNMYPTRTIKTSVDKFSEILLFGWNDKNFGLFQRVHIEIGKTLNSLWQI